MSQVKGKDTKPEILVRSALFRQGLRYRKHLKGLPGRPDIVFTRARIAVFVDGDFWHGYGYDEWKEKLSPFWLKKIGDNIQRDRRNFARLQEMGWRVLRIWEHDIKECLDDVVEDIAMAVRSGEASVFEIV